MVAGAVAEASAAEIPVAVDSAVLAVEIPVAGEQAVTGKTQEQAEALLTDLAGV